jgi:hypothetical protein
VNRKETNRTACALLFLLALAAHPADSQVKGGRRLRFVRGAAAASGVLRPGTREARHEYAFTAKAGQRLEARVASGRVRLAEGVESGAVFHLTDAEGRLVPDFGDHPWGGPKEWAGALPGDGVYKIVVFVEDGPDDPDPATLRRRKVSLPYRLSVTLR